MGGVDASALAQRIRFLREPHFGRCGAGVLSALAKHSKAAGVEVELDPPLLEGLAWLTENLPAARPRVVEVGRAEALWWRSPTVPQKPRG